VGEAVRPEGRGNAGWLVFVSSREGWVNLPEGLAEQEIRIMVIMKKKNMDFIFRTFSQVSGDLYTGMPTEIQLISTSDIKST
jgi:hypothetical protein